MDVETSSLLSCVAVVGPTALAVAALFGMIWIVNRTTLQRERDLQKAQKNYMHALRALKHAPADGALRQEAVRCGQEYARLLRSSGDEMDFGERALRIDLQVVSGSNDNAVELRNRSPMRARLRRLRKLHSERVISHEEYRKRREAILHSK